MTHVWYNLEGSTPVPVPKEKVDFFNRWHVRTKVGRFVVSTTFLSLDHSLDGSRPLLFETMVFGGPIDGETERFHTLMEADEGHARWVKRVQEVKDE